MIGQFGLTTGNLLRLPGSSPVDTEALKANRHSPLPDNTPLFIALAIVYVAKNRLTCVNAGTSPTATGWFVTGQINFVAVLTTSSTPTPTGSSNLNDHNVAAVALTPETSLRLQSPFTS